MGVFADAIDQGFGIPKPTLTEKNLPSQAGRVLIVTGGYGGVGEQLSKILYGADGTVYVAGRSQEKATKAIDGIKAAHPSSKGKIEFLRVDFADLTTIKPAVDEFLGKESRLDVLTLNAGVAILPAGSKTAQGHELQLGTNCLGSFLLAELLRPILASTAKSASPGSVRVTWAGSMAIDFVSPKPGGMVFDASEAGKPKLLWKLPNYGQSKTGNLYMASEAKKRWGDADGVVHICWNPGNLKTGLQRHTAGAFMINFILHPAIYGAYTELYSGWSDDLGLADSGSYIKPWGRKGSNRPDIVKALTDGKAAAFWDWCDRETSRFKGEPIAGKL